MLYYYGFEINVNILSRFSRLVRHASWYTPLILGGLLELIIRYDTHITDR